MEQGAISQTAGLTCEVEEQMEDDDDDDAATTVAPLVEPQQQDTSKELLPVVAPIGAALCVALLAVAFLLRTQKKRQLELAKAIRERPPAAEEIVYMDPVELAVIDKMLAPSEDDDDEEEGSRQRMSR